MAGDDRGIVFGRDLVAAAAQQPAVVAARQHQLTETLHRHQRQDGRRERHAARLSTTQLEVKPGPIALRPEQSGRPRFGGTPRDVIEDGAVAGVPDAGDDRHPASADRASQGEVGQARQACGGASAADHQDDVRSSRHCRRSGRARRRWPMTPCAPRTEQGRT